ncbi:hypothetical protein ESCO_000722 [Escovopsis weberi]|uniref:Uncharacterized protein n=1 Tax=Escovopsis weberi TaxID=150374 RepID=A0A0M8N3R6_ESCWE|nr:hypothetical protein ESCO_000722 [Escovopsis weberi]
MAPETPKVVSSRLLTMKFMQRAVASSASSSSSPASPDTDPQSSSKRRKLQHNPSPAQSRLHAQIDEAAIKAALEDQEAKRQAALSQHLAADSHWVINPSLIKPGASAAKTTPAPLNIVYVGYGDIDSGNESGYEDSPQIGRTYNQAPKAAEKKKAC